MMMASMKMIQRFRTQSSSRSTPETSAKTLVLTQPRCVQILCFSVIEMTLVGTKTIETIVETSNIDWVAICKRRS